MSFLSKISNLRKSNPVIPTKADPPSSQPVTYQAPSLLPNSYTRKEDPAIRRLKEKRQKESLRKRELSKKAHVSRRGSAPKRSSTKKDSDDDHRTETRFKKISGGSVGGLDRPTHISAAQMKKHEPIKKMSFEELMKQADSNANMKDSHGSNGYSVAPVNVPSRVSSHINKQSLKNSDRRRNADIGESMNINLKPAIKSRPIPNSKHIKIPQPKNDIARPNELIRKRLEAKKKASRVARKIEMDHYGSDMDDFIEDDNEDVTSAQQGLGYDRDEIWALFNRGKRRSDYEFDDEDEDDMEANEMEIIEEEERARKMARLEDKREEEWLRKHDMQKKRRKKARC